jgi:hypothetical protein
MDYEQLIANKWLKNKSDALADLKLLMAAQNIDYLVYKIYTPKFNDGDDCTPVVAFIGLPNRIYQDELIILDKTNPSRFDTYDLREIDEDIVDDFERNNIDDILVEILKSTLAKGENIYDITDLYPKYTIPNFNDFLYTIAYDYFNTNVTGVIELKQGELTITEKEYECGF